MLVAHGARLVMACGVCVLVGELFIPLAWCGEGDMGLRARVALRLSGCPLLVPSVWVA